VFQTKHCMNFGFRTAVILVNVLLLPLLLLPLLLLLLQGPPATEPLHGCGTA